MIEIDVLIEGKSFPQYSSSVALVKETVSSEKQNYYLLDTGSFYDRSKLIDAIENRNLKTKDIQYVILSHWHVDHIGNIDLFEDANIIITKDCIKNNIDLDTIINSLQSDNKVKEMAELLITLFPDSGYSLAKFEAMANLSIRHKEQIHYICEILKSKRVRIISDSHEEIIRNVLSVYTFDYHTREDLVTIVRLNNKNAFFMGDVVLDSKDKMFFEKLNTRDLGITEKDLIIPGHGKPFYWSVF